MSYNCKGDPRLQRNTYVLYIRIACVCREKMKFVDRYEEKKAKKIAGYLKSGRSPNGNTMLDILTVCTNNTSKNVFFNLCGKKNFLTSVSGEIKILLVFVVLNKLLEF